MQAIPFFRPWFRRFWSVLWTLAVTAACGNGGLPGEELPAETDTRTAEQPLVFSSPMSFDELRGLPLPPSTMDLTVQELLRILPTPRYSELRTVLQTKHQPTDKVRLLASYARDYPVFLKGNQVLLPNADGVFATQSPVTTVATLTPSACNSTHVCASLYEAGMEAQPYAALVLVAHRVELAGPVETGGTSLLIATGEFVSHGHPLRTSPGARPPPPPPPQETPGQPRPPAPNGRNGRKAGQFLLYANVLNGVRVNTTGEPGEAGTDGLPGEAGPISHTITGNHTLDPMVSCSTDAMVKEAQQGGNGGKAGASGDILVRYTSLIGRGPVRDFNKAGNVTPEQCFADGELHCQSLRCRWNPSIALCDLRSEADNVQCADGIDNDHNGFTDCQDYACSKNPHVTVCPDAAWSPLMKEVSAEACSDGKDNDGDGKTDCLDPQCGVRAFCQESRPSNSEYSEQACLNGVDDDGDGYTDCQDYGCQNYSTVPGCGTGGEGGEEACGDHRDNDGDGLGDCQDPGCAGTSVCSLGPDLALTRGTEEATQISCTDGLDNDLDGAVDCADRECQVNPRVTVCGTERTLLNCTDGLDNDGDGKVDCADSGCANNPYVKLCEPQYYPFLDESTSATCSDHQDNDGDGFADCHDFQCLNNPLASGVCSPQENTVAACSDGVDNDNDGKVDCAEDSCSQNPFHGDLLCRGQSQTYHQVSQAVPYNGRYTDLEAEFISPAASGGRAGKKGARDYVQVTVVVQAPPGSCEHYDDYLCQPRNELRNCYVGASANAGTVGAAGAAGKQHNPLRVSRRDVDMLRALLAPQTWRVGAAHGNALFKRGELSRAAFHYTQDSMEMGGILAHAKLDCDAVPTGKPFPEVYLHGALCSVYRQDLMRLNFLRSQRNFYGLAKDTPFNPHVRYEQRRSEFNTLYGVLDSSVSQWLSLSNGVQLSAWMQQNATQLDNEVTELGAELIVADQRLNVAVASMNALQQSMDNRKAAIQVLTEDIQTTDQRIVDKYKAQNKGFGEFVLDLVGSLTAAYGGQFLTDLAGQAVDALWGEVKKGFESESSATPVPGAGPASHEEDSLVSGLWDALAEAATKAAASKPFKDELKKGGTELWDIVSGNQESPPRSLVADEVKKEILSQSQVEITLDLMDLQAQVSKARAEYRLALMERDTVLLRQRNAVAARNALQSILSFGTGTELTAFEQILMGQQVYATAVRTLDQLIFRYWELVRLAEYQSLPFDPATGQSAIPADFLNQYDFNLLTYPQMQTRLVQLDALATHAVQSQTEYARTVPGASFSALNAGELERLKSLGDLPTLYPSLVGARFQITASDLATSPGLAARNGHRIRNVRVNLVTAAGTQTSVPAFLVRDTLDSFMLGNYVAEFELVNRDRFPNGNPRSVLHYLQFSACVSAPPPLTSACSVAPGGSSPASNSFYDRSLLGEWMLVLDANSHAALGTVQEAQIVFDVTGTII
ncbi:hypothetical protein POL68_03670 [Stigmatella sp. ncwal1]|uniref:Thrombospondin type 3 repeat-containing protein n=1 Tax=Stigmatella ashevillensis TaxID=2995309 RepID=A0ABT5D3D4_9BACT|nr:hypothetical protein [Stigmatella ashevillena]MDC0707559.1 hypothetical protein [Stigmatella ashevillena]